MDDTTSKQSRTQDEFGEWRSVLNHVAENLWTQPTGWSLLWGPDSPTAANDRKVDHSLASLYEACSVVRGLHPPGVQRRVLQLVDIHALLVCGVHQKALDAVCVERERDVKGHNILPEVQGEALLA